MKKIFIGICLLVVSNILNAQFQQLTKLVANDRAEGNQLGGAVAINGNYAVVGAPDISEGNIPNSGQCAYVFERSNDGTWKQIQKLVASDKAGGDNFGQSVSINGNYIIIGAPGKDNGTGAAYIFKRNTSGNWAEEKKIVAADRNAGDLFGTSVSITSVYGRGDDSYALVGAPGDADYGTMPKLTGAGSAYFFTNLGGGTWQVLHKAGPAAGTYYDRSAYAGFGTSVSISGDAAVIGAPGEKKDTAGSNPLDAAGAVYVFHRPFGAFELRHKIVNWDRATGDQFGYSVAINGKTIMVGAPFEDENNSTRYTTLLSAGSVYVYEKKSDDNWHWIDKLTPTDRATGDNFGHSVSLSGNTAVIGAVAADEAVNSLSSTGAAYIFLYDANLYGWSTKQIKIVANDRAANDWFGYAVAVDGENILVGAPFQDRNQTRIMANDAGAAYIFGKVSCSSSSSSISPIACKTYTSPSKKYSWTRSGTYTDTVLNKTGCDSIISINLSITGQADTSVTVKGNTLTANAKNASYQWIDCKTNQPINVTTRSLIASVSGSYKVSIDENGCTGVSSCHTIKESPVDSTPSNPPVTTAPVTNSVLKEFVEINKLVPKDRGGYENFGYAVAISGEYAVIGANVDDKDANGNNPINDAGSAYIFKKGTDGKWKEVQKIVASDREAGDNFGWSVAISINHIVVGAIYHDKDLSGNNHGPSSGAAYVFERGVDGVWAQKQKLIANPLEGQILFGNSVAIDGNTIAVGCPWYAKDSSGKPETNITAAGAIFVFDKTGGAWIQSQIITVNNRTIDNLGDDLGNAVSICGDLIIAGAWGDDFNASGGQRMEAAGAAYIFERTGGKWKQVQKIVPADRAAHDEFGVTVAISGDNAIIGARAKTETSDPNSRAYTGNAYIFSRRAAPNHVRPDGGVILAPEDGTWKQVLKINPEDRRSDDYLGWSVGISGDYAIVSALKQDTDSLDNRIADGGAIYVYYQDKNGRWSQAGKLATFDRSQLDNFGYAVAISGCDIIGGTIVDQEDDKDANALTSAGSAYIFSAADCKNVAPCYRPKVTPDIKTPKTINNNNPVKSDTTKNKIPGKIKSPDLNSKGNEVAIEPIDIIQNNNPANYDFSNVKICVDIIKENLSLPPSTREPFYYYIPQINPDGTLKDVGVIKQELVGYTDKMWSTGETIKVGFFNDAGATTNIIEKIKKYATEWEKYANVKFEFVDAVAKAQIKIGFADKGKAWSWYGRDILINPFGVATMNFGWFNSQTTDKEFRVTIQHEFGHALGFVHEHQSPAAGISWYKEKVYAFFAKDPPKWSRAEVDDNVFKMYNKTSLNYSAYDPFSIMHYFFPVGLTTDGTAFPDVDYISGTDIQYAKLFYPFAPIGKNATGILRTTDDCDEIDFSVEYNVVDTTIIEFTLEPGKDHNNKLVTWWKRIGVPSKGGVFIDLEIENGSIANKKIPVLMIDNNRGIAFSKAKLLGIHTLLNYKWNVMPALRGGCHVKLTWRRDTCL